MSKTGSFIDDFADVPGFNSLESAPHDRGLRVTGEDADGDYDDSGDDLGTRGKAQRETFPCESCQGTGRYRGVRLHQPAVECFACKGRGYFFKSFKDRQDARAKRAARKERVIAEAKNAFEQAHPELVAGMRKHASWNDFLARLLADVDAGKSLHENAIAAAQKAVDKANARDAERDAEKARRLEGAAVVNADQLKVAFDAAARNGLKRPVLRYDGFQVSRAPDHGKNAGALYVKDGSTDTYLGKIVGGKYIATREAEAAGIVSRVVEAMNDPLAAAIAYGKRTGSCSCCGRKLTDRQSVANGIGPICAEKYGWEDQARAGSEEDVAAAFPQAKVATAVTGQRTVKYEYPEGMSEDDKRKFRAAARRAAKKEA